MLVMFGLDSSFFFFLMAFQDIVETETKVSVISNLNHFGAWTQWWGCMAGDKEWNDVLAKQSEGLWRFGVKSTEDVMPTPSVLKIWRQTEEGNLCVYTSKGLCHTFSVVAIQH